MSLSDYGKEDQSPYEVHSKREIMAYMRAIKNHNELVSMTLPENGETLVTSVLHVSDDTEASIVLDGANTERLNQRFAQAEEVNFSVSLDHIKIMFTAHSVRACTYDERPAFLIGLPEHFIRLQRREYYRVTTPITHPVLCHIPMDTAEGKKTIALPLLDISCGGIALRDEKKQLDVTGGTEYKNCRLELQGTIITVNLQVRNSMEQTMAGNLSKRRVGCAFVNTPNAMLSAVQRYIMKLECEQKSRISGI